ncbi:DUF167 domain-containing protein [Yinghuangia sp. YIM S09857]|uniref:DUF167 domain-containing protein n=1 Tax=Yinghuangia sp. YIM S09857 TaxID=3436929 RepID=UPI003F532BEB
MSPASAPAPCRIAIRVKPGASRTAVGGTHGDALVVAVNARAVEGKATEAALKALAAALGVRRRQITLVTGATSRDKVVEVAEPPPDLAVTLAALRG